MNAPGLDMVHVAIVYAICAVICAVTYFRVRRGRRP